MAQVAEMSRGAGEAKWGLGGEVLAAIYNTVRDAKKRSKPFTGRDFNPYAPPPRPDPRRERHRGIAAFAPLIGLSADRVAEQLAKEGDDGG